MFHVLVLGGIALVGGVGACGGSVSTPTDAGSRDHDSGLPSELDASNVADAGHDTGFPSELPAFVDAAVGVFPDASEASDASSDRGFPTEAQ